MSLNEQPSHKTNVKNNYQQHIFYFYYFCDLIEVHTYIHMLNLHKTYVVHSLSVHVF